GRADAVMRTSGLASRPGAVGHRPPPRTQNTLIPQPGQGAKGNRASPPSVPSILPGPDFRGTGGVPPGRGNRPARDVPAPEGALCGTRGIEVKVGRPAGGSTRKRNSLVMPAPERDLMLTL